MTTRESVLAYLRERQGEYCSGQDMADNLGISRTAVWKAIRALEGEGFRIDASPNRGYALSPMEDVLSGEAVQSRLGELPLRVEYEPRVTGTNALLRERAAAGEPEGLVLLAGSQEAGRGRSGRSFFSPPDTGLYLSLLLRPGLVAEQAPMLTVLAAVAAARAAEELCGQEIRIKWVNDLLCGGRKVCGILTEAALSLETGGLDYAVLGLGFNLSSPENGWPEELRDIAGSLFPEKAPVGSRAALAASFLGKFWPLYRHFDPDAFLPEYRRRQAVLGRWVEILAPGQASRRGRALDVDGQGRLLVQYADGSRGALYGGEVRILPTADPKS